MKNITKYILFAGLLTLGMASCNNDDGITPSEITNLKSETRAGQIVLRWDKPTDGTVQYVKVVYTDPRLSKTVTRLASIYADSILIPDTRARYDEYQFTVFTVSSTGDESSKQTVSQKSEAALASIKESKEEIKLTVNDLSTNAQEPSEGPIANLLDGDTGTHFHSAWSITSPDQHWIQVNLNTTLDDHYVIYYAPRNNTGQKPLEFDLMGSTDGENWQLIKKFTKEEDNLPTTAKDAYESPALPCTFPFSMIRFVMIKNTSGDKYITMSEFKFYSASKSVFDPEDPEQDLAEVI